MVDNAVSYGTIRSTQPRTNMNSSTVTKIVPSSEIVNVFDVETGSNLIFTVKFIENAEGLREFEIILSKNGSNGSDGSDEYDEVYAHPFYINYIIPWTCRRTNIKPLKPANVVNLNAYRRR